jgi:hypothetical protein
MGRVVGRSTANGGEPADNPVTLRHLIGTILHALLDVAGDLIADALSSPSSSARANRSGR